jgi:hypothetical protein
MLANFLGVLPILIASLCALAFILVTQHFKCTEDHYILHLKMTKVIRAPMAHACSPSYFEGRDQEDCGSKPAWADSLPDSISKIATAKRTEGVAQAVKCLLCKYEALSSKPSPTENKID